MEDLIKSKVAVYIKDNEIGKGYSVHVVFGKIDNYEEAEIIATVVNELIVGSENFQTSKGTVH
tara:strand:+ start:64 stop:252 length:189 start_codon:yes stop_codon:yes gene_type:complete